jgi:hypothetical protein
MNSTDPKPFKIRITRTVVFTDLNKKILQVFEAGDILVATKKTSDYYITSMGGIYFDEAEEIGK